MLFFHFKTSLKENRLSQPHEILHGEICDISLVTYQILAKSVQQKRRYSILKSRYLFSKNAKILKRAIPRLNGSTSCHKIWHGQMYDKNRLACQILASQPIQKRRYDCSKLSTFFWEKIKNYKKMIFSPIQQKPPT